MKSRICCFAVAALLTQVVGFERGFADSQVAVAGRPYTVTVAPVSASKGQPAQAAVVIKAGAGYHINEEFPTKLSLKPVAGVQLAKADLSKSDAKLSKNEGRFDVTLTATETGKKTVSGELRFAVCTESTCEPQSTQIRIEVSVK